MPEFTIIFTIERADQEDEPGQEIGFGSSGGWPTVDAAAQAVSSMIDNREWDTNAGMPDPKEASR